jgi:hypothetical protein
MARACPICEDDLLYSFENQVMSFCHDTKTADHVLDRASGLIPDSTMNTGQTNPAKLNNP